jgi:hypothetical protein
VPIYKPQTSKGPVVLLEYDTSTPPTMTLATGEVVQAVKGDRAGGVYKGHEGFQWVFPRDILGQEGATLTVDGKSQEIPQTNMSYRGNTIGDLEESSKGAIGDVGSTSSGIQGGFEAGNVGYGVAPAFIGDLFPDATVIGQKGLKSKYKEISPANYNFVDPLEFGKKFGTFQRGELEKNFAQAKGFALDAVDTELQALQSYVPKSSALKREQTAIDNTFNQGERTRQVYSAVPDVVGDLNSIASDARSYASGNVPNSIANAALELGNRSAAADIATNSGFGVRSSAARKLSDLMSAKDRIGLSQYGNQLLGQNAGQRADLLLAPTQYSDAGAQVRVAPTVSASQLQQQSFGDINQASLTTPGQALSTQVQQNQFQTDLQQQTSQFNAQNNLQNNQFNSSMKFNVRNANAQTINNFALSKFNYLNSYVNSVAAAGQTNMNTGIALDQQAAAQEEASRHKKKTQTSNTIKDAVSGLVTVGSAIIGFSDSRLKDVAHPLTEALAFLKKLPVYNYTYKAGTVGDDGGKKHIGVLAQDLKEVLPDAVAEHTSGYLMVNPTELIYVLIQAVKELEQKLEDRRV